MNKAKVMLYAPRGKRSNYILHNANGKDVIGREKEKNAKANDRWLFEKEGWAWHNKQTARWRRNKNEDRDVTATEVSCCANTISCRQQGQPHGSSKSLFIFKWNEEKDSVEIAADHTATV